MKGKNKNRNKGFNYNLYQIKKIHIKNKYINIHKKKQKFIKYIYKLFNYNTKQYLIL